MKKCPQLIAIETNQHTCQSKLKMEKQCNRKLFSRNASMNKIAVFLKLHPFLAHYACTYHDITTHNELKREKNSNFKCVFGWLHFLPQRLKSTFFEIFSSLLQESSTRQNFKKRIFQLLRQTHSKAKMDFFSEFQLIVHFTSNWKLSTTSDFERVELCVSSSSGLEAEV